MRSSVIGELPDVEVIGDDVIDGANLARRQLVTNLFITGTPSDDFAPSLGRKSVFGRCGFVPRGAFRDVVNPFRNFGG